MPKKICSRCKFSMCQSGQKDKVCIKTVHNKKPYFKYGPLWRFFDRFSNKSAYNSVHVVTVHEIMAQLQYYIDKPRKKKRGRS